MEPDCVWCRIYKRERDKTRSDLAQSQTTEERALIKTLRREIRIMQEAAEKRNLALDAMHFVWCDGGCETGVHRFDGEGPEAVTQEVVDAAVRNTERLKTWWRNRKGRSRR